MNNDFPRLLTLLRKERNISQKQAAEDLGVAQALLSHYENGKRECGLDFLVKAADYYEVSADYLLGRSAVSSGAVISQSDLEGSAPPEKAHNLKPEELSSAFAQNLIGNSLEVLFSLLAKAKNPALTDKIYDIFSFAIYRAFRIIYRTNPANDKNVFKIPENEAEAYISAGEEIAAAKAAAATDNSSETPPEISRASLEVNYGKKASVLLSIAMRCEDRIKKIRDCDK